MTTLYVLYDSRCGICSRLRTWITTQRAYSDFDFVPAGSPRARLLFPELLHRDEPKELRVITEDGDVYVDDAAWIICLYALVDYRAWSFRLARAPFRSLARGAWELLSSNRGALSRMLALTSDAELARRLEQQPPGVCELDQDPRSGV